MQNWRYHNYAYMCKRMLEQVIREITGYKGDNKDETFISSYKGKGIY